MAFTSDVRAPRAPMHWRWVLFAAAVSALFTLLAGLASAPSQSAVLAAVLNVLAFLLTGVLTCAISRTAAPRDAALGATVMAAIVAGVQAFLMRGKVEGLTPARMFTSLLVLLALAWGLTWLGGRMGEMVQRRRNLPPDLTQRPI